MTLRRQDPLSSSQLTMPPAAKITPPAIPNTQVRRDRLLHRLAAAPGDQLVMVCAPAGSGKTQLLAAWAANRSEPTAWVTIDHADNDNRRFWSAIVSALRACSKTPATVDLARLGTTDLPNTDAAYAAALAESVGEGRGPVTLILDDLHHVSDPVTLQGLSDLITNCRSQLRLVLVSRGDPPIRLGRLRLDHDLLELRGPDLAFTVEETGLLAYRAGLTLSDEQLSLLIDQTAGWAAGLRLAALAMRRTDPAVILADLVGTTSTISDYLVDEVLSGLTAEAQVLLDCIAVFGQLTVPLAQDVAGVYDAAALLAELESVTALVTSFGDQRRWFQLHPLLRAHLLVDIHRFRPELEYSLHRRATCWFEQHGDFGRAIQHSLRSGDPTVVHDLVTRHGVRLLKTGHHASLRSAAATFPEVFTDDPQLALTAAAAHLDVGDIEAAHQFAERASANWPATPTEAQRWLAELTDGRLLLLSAKPTMLATDEHAPDRSADPELVVLTRATRATIERQSETSLELAGSTIAAGRGTGNDYLAARGVALLAIGNALAGDLAAAWDLSTKVDSVAPAVWRGTIDDALTATLRAQAALYQGEPEDCLSIIEGLASHPSEPTFTDRSAVGSWQQLLTSAAVFDRGQRVTGLDGLAELRSGIDPNSLPPELVAGHVSLEHDFALQLNRPEQARDVVGWADQIIGGSADLRYLRAHAAARISRLSFAQHELAPILVGDVRPLNPLMIIDSWLLTAAIRLRLDERERAIAALTRALSAAEASAVLRPLLRAPTELLDLLGEQLDSWGRHEATVRMIIAKRGRTATPASALTQRECQVLNLLQAQLSLAEIAEDLTVSQNTIKSHVRSIYSKLGAGSRREAIRVARSQGLL